MVLVLAVHTVKEVSAKVSFSTILLQDLVVNKKVPAEFKCRQVRIGADGLGRGVRPGPGAEFERVHSAGCPAAISYSLDAIV